MGTSVKRKLCLICLQRFGGDNHGSSLKNVPQINQNELIDNETTVEPSDFEAIRKDDGGTDDNGGGDDLYQRFLKFVGRYFKLRQMTHFLLEDARQVKDDNGEVVALQVFCEGCRILVKETCDLFYELEKVKLLLLGKVGQVGQRMKVLGHRVSQKCGRGLLVEMKQQLNAKTLNQVEKFRTVVRLKCRNAGKNAVPRVSVPRGLCPEYWKFTYYLTKKALIKLIVVFMLSSIKPPEKVKAIDDNDVSMDITDDRLGDSKRIRTRRKARKVMTEVQTESEDDCNDNEEGNGNDSDWCGDNLASPVGGASFSEASEPEENHEVSVKDENTPEDKPDNEDDGLDTSYKPVKRTNRFDLKCPKCPRKFVNHGCLSIHLRKVHRAIPDYPCTQCGARFTVRDDMLQHKYKAHPKPKVRTKCTVCNAEFSSAFTMRRHRRKRQCIFLRKPRTKKSVQDTRQKCPVCFKLVKGNLERHLKVHEMEKSGDFTQFDEIWYCDVCGRFIQRQESVSKHMKRDHGNTYPCFTCKATFTSGTLLLDHLLKEHENEDDQNFHCLFCYRGFTNEQYYNIHKSVLHKDKRRKFCTEETCHANFDSAEKLNEHLKTHMIDPESGQVLVCQTCHVGYLQERKLKIHELWHASKSTKVGKGFDCPICQKNFITTESLVVHYNIKHNDKEGLKKRKKIKCKVCNKEFLDWYNLQHHVKGHKEDKEDVKFICDVCGKEMSSQKTLRKHIRKIHESKADVDKEKVVTKKKNRSKTTGLKCQVDNCQKRLFAKVALEHVETEHENKWTDQERNFYCYFCCKKFHFERSRELHLSIMHPKTRTGKVKCDAEECEDIDFQNREELNQHLQSCHGSVELFSCQKCHWQFVRKEACDIHHLEHQPMCLNKLYDCTFPECNFVGTTKAKVQTHFSKVHGTKVGFYKCDLCAMKLTSLTVLYNHKYKHSLYGDEGSRICELCGKTLKGKYELENHLRLVHPKELLPCPEEGCGQQFRNRELLRKHLGRVHDKGEFWICDFCGTKFTERHKFRYHMSIHLKGKPWECKICGLKLTREKQLMIHMERKHNEGEREGHVCTVCGKSFLSVEGLKYHFAASHQSESEWKFECDYCQKRFYRRLFLNTHLKTCRGGGGDEVTVKRVHKKRKLERNVELEENSVPEEDKPETFPADVARINMEQWMNQFASGSSSAIAQPSHSSNFQPSQQMQYQFGLPQHGLPFENKPNYS